MRNGGKIAAGVFLALLTVLCLDAAIDLWPAIGVQSDVCAHVRTLSGADNRLYTDSIKEAYKISCRFAETPLVRINLEGLRMVLSPDQGLLAISGLFGLLGGVLYSLLALGAGLSRGTAAGASAFWLAISPFAACAVALIAYVAVRAVVLPQGNVASLNPYGFLAMAAITGFLAAVAIGRFTRG